jgi:hypothetical protein
LGGAILFISRAVILNFAVREFFNYFRRIKARGSGAAATLAEVGARRVPCGAW